MSEMFDKSQMSETIDVPAGCKVGANHGGMVNAVRHVKTTDE